MEGDAIALCQRFLTGVVIVTRENELPEIRGDAGITTSLVDQIADLLLGPEQQFKNRWRHSPFGTHTVQEMPGQFVYREDPQNPTPSLSKQLGESIQALLAAFDRSNQAMEVIDTDEPCAALF
jgi:hypothetical protein